MKPLCVKCQMEFKVEKNGVIVVELFQEDKEIYKIWHADLHRCPVCGFEIIGGYASEPTKQNGADSTADMNDYVKYKKMGGMLIFYSRERPLKEDCIQ